MSIQFPCPHCQELMTIPERFAGMKRICSNCRGELTAPELTTENKAAAAGSAGASYLVTSTDAATTGAAAGKAERRDGRGQRTSRAAIFAVLCGVASFPIFFMALPGLLLGIIGRSSIRRSDGRLRGTGLAWTGMLLSVASLILYSTFMMTTGQQVVQTVRYVYGRVVTEQRMSQLHQGMQASLVKGVVLPKTLELVASRGKFEADVAQPAIGDMPFVYLGAGRTAEAMTSENILVYWPLLTESGEVLSLFGDGNVRSLAPEELDWMLKRQGDHMVQLKPNDVLPEQVLKWIRDAQRAEETAGPASGSNAPQRRPST